jgi:hypothetical protein
MGASTLGANILLGWMDREEAISHLVNDCRFDPQITRDRAEELWTEYRGRVDALPEREIQPPVRFPIPDADRQIVNNFLSQFRGPEVLDVIKINPLELIIYQTYVVTDRADHHAEGPGNWARKTLVMNRPTNLLPWRVEDGTLKFSLPHAEHQIWINPNGQFGIQQGGGFVSVAEIEGRLFLKAGYHRSFAFARAVTNEPEANAKSMLVALTRALPPQLTTDFPHQGLRTTVLGRRPPLLADFFDLRLAMTVRLRRKKYEAHFQGKVVPVDDP